MVTSDKLYTNRSCLLSLQILDCYKRTDINRNLDRGNNNFVAKIEKCSVCIFPSL